MSGLTVLAPGAVFAADYRIEKPLKEGGMGAVYIAEQISTSRRCALKVMQPELVKDAEARKRFTREAKIGGQLQSDFIVQVLQAGVDETTGMPWLAMELLEGEDLEEYADKKGRLAPEELLKVFDPLCEALGEAHGKNIVHRDLKPENIFLAKPRRKRFLRRRSVRPNGGCAGLLPPAFDAWFANCVNRDSNSRYKDAALAFAALESGARTGAPRWTLGAAGTLVIVSLGVFACTRSHDSVSGSGSASGTASSAPVSTAAAPLVATTPAPVAPPVPIVTAPLVATTPAPVAPPVPTAPECGEGMVKILGGTFSMGSDNGGDSEKPAHPVTVKTFCIDRTEVTTAAYQACVGTRKCTPAEKGGHCNAGQAARKNHPINCVNWDQGRAFCAAQNKRLPTEEEWEFAARGTEGRLYPWGSAAPSNQVCWDGEGNDLGNGNRKGTCAVGQYSAGNTPLGVADMAGNVWEWTASFYCPYGAETKGQSCTNDTRVSRGGSWYSVFAWSLRGAYRDRGAPSNAGSLVGFRCSQDFP
ncbi:MAG: SUMF1/EgtB/PvdO family nonheme iron enzyme [Polyangiaceae bacterium]|nr:SUMF1/EgtB/PvdO family nonheme iron enzyme [Polyangiaceae bacterium]